MDEARIAELLAPFLSDSKTGRVESATLSPNQLHHISMYVDILLRWNARINLTAVRQPEEIVTRHFGESIFAARHLFPKSESRGPGLPRGEATAHVIDVGSGAGFPGLPIKIWAPQQHLTLIESNQKKASFLREVVRSLRLEGVDVFAGRAEDFPAGQGDVVTFRAVERFEAILPVAARLVAPEGRLAILAGVARVKPIRDLAAAFTWSEPAAMPLSDRRSLIIGRKEPS